MPKDDYLSAAIKATDATKKMSDVIAEAMKEMEAKFTKSIFAGPPPASGSPNPFTGLRSILNHPDAWKFGTVHRDRHGHTVMVVGPRRVISLDPDTGEVEDTVEDWFDYWDVEPET